MNVRGVAPHLAVASLATAGIVGLAEIQVRTFATAAVALVAWATFRATAAHPRCAAHLVVRCASLAPTAPMLLAIVYAVGRVTSVSAPSIATMERAHGLTNALLFACVGLAGWRRLTGSGAEAVTATPVFVDAAPSLVPQEDTDAIARFT